MAQPTREVEQQYLGWFRYFQTLEVKKFTLQSEVENRMFLKPTQQLQFIVRSVLNYSLPQNWSVGAGFTTFLNWPANPNATTRLMVPEYRFFEEVNYKQPTKHVIVTHRLRVEQRMFQNNNGSDLQRGVFLQHRFRYQLGLDFPVHKQADKKNTVLVRFATELHVQAGEKIVYNVFDQTRTTVGVQYRPIDEVGMELNYLYWYQQRSSGYQFYSRHILRVTLVHRIVVRDKKKKD